MKIRPATPEDVAALAQLQGDAWRRAFRGIMPDPYDQPPVERLREGLQLRIGDRGAPLLVAEEGGEVRGFASIGPSRYEPPPVGEVYAFFVHPDHWRRGTGKRLLAQALEDLRSRGFPEVTLWSLAGNDRANRFYEASGFRPDGATQRRPELGNPLEVRYRRRLD